MERNLSVELIESLKATDLWKKHLEKDCLSQNVFLAIRNNYIDFYHKGGRLFEFGKNGFKTHTKYASVIDNNGDYLTEAELSKCKIIPDFCENYPRIKENCALYSGVEAAGVSTILSQMFLFGKK
jgi:hypothetical protein